MDSKKTAVILINIGTPDSPAVKDVRNYLSEFLNDYRVIDLPWLARKILVNLIIVPFRAPKSANLYKLLWTDKGSPLIFHTKSLVEKLQQQLNSNYSVFMAMRYGNPSIRKVLDEIKVKGYSKIIVLPMFPHYASSSSGTAIEFVFNFVKGWTVIPEIKVVGQFYNDPHFINAFANRIKAYNPESYEHVLFSYHGLPLSHIEAVHCKNDCSSCDCINEMPLYGGFCYKATCYETTRLLANKLNLPKGTYSQSFQSRLSKRWLTPFSDKVLISKAQGGVKRILVVAPAFVADCLETTVELGVEYRRLFTDNGGIELNFVESLNDTQEWVDTLKGFIDRS